MKDCLEAHREDTGFSAECKDELEAMMEKRAADFRLDSTLREVLLLVLGPGLFVFLRDQFPQMCQSFRTSAQWLYLNRNEQSLVHLGPNDARVGSFEPRSTYL